MSTLKRSLSSYGFATALGVVALFASTSEARAQEICFESAGGQMVISLADTVKLNPRCEYALKREGSWLPLPAALAGRDVGFLELYAELAGEQEVDARPRFLYGRPLAASTKRRGTRRRVRLEAAEQALALRFCSHYLMEEELAFRLRPGDRLLLERVPKAQCGGTALELWAVDTGEGQGPMVHRGEAAHRLDLRDSRLAIDHGAWVFYVARPGSKVALRVGQLSSKAARSPLRTHIQLAAVDRAPALLRSRFTGVGGSLELVKADEGLTPSLWMELRTASAGGALWLARRKGSSGALEAIEPVHMNAERPAQADGEPPHPIAAVVDDASVRDWMRRRYGPLAGAMVPNAGDWKGLFDELEICVGPSYREPVTLSAGASVPKEMTCAKLAKLASSPEPGAEAKAAGVNAVQICIDHGMQVMRSDESERLEGQRQCISVEAAQRHIPIAVRGDRITFEGAADSCVVLEGQPLQPDEQGGYSPASAGLLELRTGCAAAQGLAVARVAVIDPERQWHPVGLVTGEADPESLPWQRLRHDEEDTFFFSGSRRDLDTRMSYSPLLPGAFDGADTALSEALSPANGLKGILPGGRPPALVTYVSRSESCSEEPASVLREQVPVDPEGVIIDGTFYVFLAAYEGEAKPLRCLARSRYRVHSSRSVFGTAAGRVMQMEVGLLGDVRGLLFFTEPFAAGLSLSLVNLRITLVSFLSFDIAASFVGAGAFNTGEFSRLGLGFSAALELGVPEILPRIISVGAMAHLAAQTASNPMDNVYLSGYAALNLSTLIDLLGGR